MLVLILGALASVYTVLDMGRDNPSIVLMAMFVVWVALPFLALLLVVRSRKGPASGGLLAFSVLLTAVTLFIYAWVAFGSVPIRKPARFFLIVPFVSLVLVTPILLRQRHR